MPEQGTNLKNVVGALDGSEQDGHVGASDLGRGHGGILDRAWNGIWPRKTVAASTWFSGIECLLVHFLRFYIFQATVPTGYGTIGWSNAKTQARPVGDGVPGISHYRDVQD